MAEEKVTKLLEEISKLTVLELNELVKALEEKFGVTAMAAVSATPTASASAEATADKEAQTVFNVVLTGAGANKLSVIKAVRELNQTLGLVDAKNLVESCPKEVLTAVNKATAEEGKKKLEAAGATVELK